MHPLGWDQQAERWIAGHRIGVLNSPAEALDFIGQWGILWILLALLITLFRRRIDLLAAVIVADIAADLLSDVLKSLTDRSRPDVNRLVALPHNSSFPSTHAATSFACATVIAILEPRLRVAAFVLAAVVAWSRLYVGLHFPLDVIGGAALGVGVGYAVVRALRMLGATRRRSRRAQTAG